MRLSSVYVFNLLGVKLLVYQMKFCIASPVCAVAVTVGSTPDQDWKKSGRKMIKFKYSLRISVVDPQFIILDPANNFGSDRIRIHNTAKNLLSTKN